MGEGKNFLWGEGRGNPRLVTHSKNVNQEKARKSTFLRKVKKEREGGG